MNDLVVLPEYDGIDAGAMVDAVPVAGAVASACEDFKEGQWAAGIVDVGAAAFDVVTMFFDPIGTLASSCAGFLMDYIPPLHQELELLTGSPEMVRAMAGTWDNLAKELDNITAEHRHTTANLIADWEGPAAYSVERTAAGLETWLDSVIKACANAAEGLRIMAMVVEVVYEIVKSIISDLVGQLISAVIEEIATLGVGTPVVAAQAGTKIANTIVRVAKWVEKVDEAMKGARKKLELLEEFLRMYEGPVGDLAGIAAKVKNIKPSVDVPAFYEIIKAVKTATEKDD